MAGMSDRWKDGSCFGESVIAVRNGGEGRRREGARSDTWGILARETLSSPSTWITRGRGGYMESRAENAFGELTEGRSTGSARGDEGGYSGWEESLGRRE